MASLDVIRTLTIRAKSEGVDQTASSLDKLASSQDNVAQSSAKQERATLSVDAALERLQRRYDQEFRANQELAKAQETLNQAREQGLITLERQNSLMQQAVKYHNAASQAMKEQAGSAVNLIAGMSSVGKATLEASVNTQKFVQGMSAAGRAGTGAGSPVGLIAGMSSIGKATLEASVNNQKFIEGMSAAGRAAASSGQVIASVAKQHNAASIAASEHSKVLAELSTVAQGLSGNLGQLGGILARIGPAGLAIAATVGGMVLGFAAASVAALKLAEDMGKLADTAEVVGLTVEKLRALQLTAGEVGVNAEQLDTALTKFTASLGAVRDGSTGAYASFNKLQGGLGDSVRSAKTTEQALNLVFEALRKADTASAALGAKEIFGKGGAGIVRVAGATESIQKLADEMNKLDVVTGTQAKTWDDLGDRIKKNMELAGTNVKASFATPVLEALDEVSKVVVELSRAIGEAAKDLGFNIDTSSIENFRVEIQVLTLEIEKFGTLKAAEDLSDRLFGPNFTTAAAAVINTVKLLGSVFLDLINIIASAVAGLASFVTLDFAGVTKQVESARASFASLGNTIEATQERMKNANDETLKLSEVSIDGLNKQTTEGARAWFAFGNQMQKIGEITPPAATAVGNLGKANDLAAGKAEKHKKEIEKLNPVVEELSKVAGQLGASLVTAFLNGDSAAKALNTTLKSISSTAANSAITKLIQGDFGGAAISGVISLGAAIGSFLFGSGDSKDQEAQQKAAEQAAAAAAFRAQQIADAQIRAADYTLRAADALEKSDFVKKLRDFDAESQKAFEQESKLAGDLAINQLIAARTAERTALLLDAVDTATKTLTNVDLSTVQQRIKEVSDAASTLAEALAAQGMSTEEAALQANALATDAIMRLADSSLTAAAPLSDLAQKLVDIKRDTTDLTNAVADLGQGAGEAALKVNGLAIDAVMQLADSTLLVAKPISDVQKNVADLVRDATDLTNALVDLGVGAVEAADAIRDKFNSALDALRAGFMDELIRSVNELAGGKWINEADDLLKKVAQMRSDAAALGISTSLIDEFYIRSAQDIIDQNQLTGDSFERLKVALNLADDGLHEFQAAIVDTANVIKRSVDDINNAIQSNEDRLFNAVHRSDSLADQLARFDLIAQREREKEIVAGGQALASLERAQAQERLNIINDFLAEQLKAQQEADQKAADAQAEADKAAAEAQQKAIDDQLRAEQQAAEERQRAIDEATKFLTGALQNIANWIQHFMAGSLSPLSPSARLASAQASFAVQKTAAMGGNRDALSGITQNAQDVIDAATAYYGSSAAGQAIITSIISQLQGLPGQVSAEQFIVDGLTTPITTVKTAVDTVTTATTTQTTVLSQQLTTLQSAFQSGNAQAIANALLPMFNTLDTNVNGLLDFNEFRTGLQGMASDSQLRDMFTRLDLDNSGSISQLELIKAATQSVDSSVDQTNSLLNAIKTQTEYLKSIDFHVSYCDHLATIVSWQPGSSHAAGGYITGGIRGRDSVHGMLTPGEFVVREPTARRNPWLSEFNRTGQLPYANDNGGGVVAALGRMERSILIGIKAMIDTQLETAGIIARPIDEANKLQRTRRGEKKVA